MSADILPFPDIILHRATSALLHQAVKDGGKARIKLVKLLGSSTATRFDIKLAEHELKRWNNLCLKLTRKIEALESI